MFVRFWLLSHIRVYIACAGHIFLQSAVIMIILQTIIMFITQHILFVSRQQYTSQVGLNIIYQLTRLKNIYNFVSSRTLSSQLIHAGQRRNLKHRWYIHWNTIDVLVLIHLITCSYMYTLLYAFFCKSEKR